MPIYPSFSAWALGLSLGADETVVLAEATGFAGVDLPLRDFVEGGGDAHALRTRMDDLGLRGGAWPLPVNWRGDAGAFGRDLRRLPRYAEAAAALGLLRTGTWVMPETPERPDRAEDFERYVASVAALHVERLGAIARVLDGQGIRLGLEVIGVETSRTGRGLPLIHRLRDLDRHLGALWNEAPSIGILVDGYHLHAAGEVVEVGLLWGAGRVVWVHVADLPASTSADRGAMRDDDRGLPGEHGAIDSKALLQRLHDEGYEGPVTVETRPGCRSLSGLSARSMAERVATALRSVWPEGTRFSPFAGSRSSPSD